MSNTPFPVDEREKRFLLRFPGRNRSLIANMFHDAVRSGAKGLQEVFRAVKSDALNRRRNIYEKCDPRHQMMDDLALAIQDEEADMRDYVAYILRYEKLSYSERAAAKETKGEVYREQHTQGQPPTQAQMDYLKALGFNGRPPQNKAEASRLIDQQKREGAQACRR